MVTVRAPARALKAERTAMRRERIDSSMMRAVGYGAWCHVLEVEFRTGAVYRYFDIPETEFVGLLAAPSKGRYFHDRIAAVYPHRRVRS